MRVEARSEVETDLQALCAARAVVEVNEDGLVVHGLPPDPEIIQPAFDPKIPDRSQRCLIRVKFSRAPYRIMRAWLPSACRRRRRAQPWSAMGPTRSRTRRGLRRSPLPRTSSQARWC